MAPNEDTGASGEPAEGADRSQDPIVERIRPDPEEPPEPTVELTGFLGDSNRPGVRRLYFTRDLDYYAEFRAEDVRLIARIPAEEHPFIGDEATRVTVRGDATIEYTRTRTAFPPDEFDLDVRLGRARRKSVDYVYTEMAYTGCDSYMCPTARATQCGTCGGYCMLPYTVADPTCAPTCSPPWQFTCDPGCKRIVEHGPSDIVTACLPHCPVPRRG